MVSPENRRRRAELRREKHTLLVSGRSSMEDTWTIQFADHEEVLPLREFTDAAIEEALCLVSHALPPDPRTGFPSFTVYRNGVEVGGG